MSAFGLKGSNSDASTMIYSYKGYFFIFLIYVDDIIVTGNNVELIEQIIKKLNKAFSLKDLSNLNYFFGVEVIQTKEGFHLNQTKYILDRVNLNDSKPIKTFMIVSQQLSKTSGEPLDNATQFRTMVGAL